MFFCERGTFGVDISSCACLHFVGQEAPAVPPAADAPHAAGAAAVDGTTALSHFFLSDFIMKFKIL